VARTLRTDRGLVDHFDRAAGHPGLDELSARERRQVDRFAALWAIRRGETVLEPGCGGGRLTAAVAEVVGTTGAWLAFDLSPGMLGRAHGRALPPRAFLAQATTSALPVATASVDVVVCLNVFPHMVDTRAAVAELNRVLRPGGRLWVHHFLDRNAVNALHRELGPPVAGHQLPSDPTLRSLLTRAGLTTVSIEDGEDGFSLHAVPAARS
jgi:demethylmenaquinone methyltransferase/2-methoxy-6-polyprenyl-1,4-benzoquinol methylase